MDWKQLLMSITRSVDQKLLLRNEYLAARTASYATRSTVVYSSVMVIVKPLPRVASTRQTGPGGDRDDGQA